MRSHHLSPALLLALPLACGPGRPLAEAETSSTGSVETTATDETTSTVTSGTSAADTTSTASSGGGFLPFDDLGDDRCDLFAQDCPPGEKCRPYSADGVSWNAVGCFPIPEDPDGLYEACTIEDTTLSGFDSCDVGLLCWPESAEDQAGTCLSLCTGDESNPECEDPGTSCFITSDDSLVYCRPLCDPLVDDCPPGQGCYFSSGEMWCFADASEGAGAPGDPCEFVNVCAPGSSCAPGESVPECMTPGCCSSFCDLGQGAAPCLPGQECEPFYPPEHVPLGYDHLGVCAIPQ